MGFGSLGGGGLRQSVDSSRYGPSSQRPDGRPSSEENRRIQQRADERAAASVPPLFGAAVWIGVIGFCLMLFDVIPSLSGTMSLVVAWAPMLGIAFAYSAVMAWPVLRARRGGRH